MFQGHPIQKLHHNERLAFMILATCGVLPHTCEKAKASNASSSLSYVESFSLGTKRIGNPIATTLRGWSVPALKHGVKVPTIDTNFPDHTRITLLIRDSEPEASGVGREANFVRIARDRDQFVSIGTVCFCQVDIGRLCKRELATVWRPPSARRYQPGGGEAQLV